MMTYHILFGCAYVVRNLWNPFNKLMLWRSPKVCVIVFQLVLLFKDNTRWSHWVILNGYPNLNTNHERWNKYESSVADWAILWHLDICLLRTKQLWYRRWLGAWSTPSHHFCRRLMKVSTLLVWVMPRCLIIAKPSLKSGCSMNLVLCGYVWVKLHHNFIISNY